MEIAPNFTDDDWKTLAFRSERDWIRAVAVLRRRLEARFLRPARSLLRQERSGFAILALDSLLVETLEQFRRGVKETPRGAAEGYFIEFLTGPYFGQAFNQTTAKLFYRTVRCGILHQAEVKSTSLVRRDSALPVRLSSAGDGVIVNPCLFHKRLERAFLFYRADLRKPTETDLRKCFRRKMDYIAQVAKPTT